MGDLINVAGTIKINRHYTQAWLDYDFLNASEVLIENFERIGRVFTGDLVKLVKNKTVTDLAGQGGALSVQLIKPGDRRRQIVGVLLLTSQQRFPANKRGIPRYQFSPLASDLPEFLVASKLRTADSTGVVNNQYVIIDFQEWPIKQARPFGQIVTVLGAVGDFQAEILARLHYRGVYLPKIKLDQPAPAICRSLEMSLKNSGLDNRNDLEVFSIDPPGCQDIDDAFSCRPIDKSTVPIDKSTVMLGVHIADVNFCLESLGIDLQTLVDRPSSVYLPNQGLGTEVRHMLPEFVAINGASLRTGQLRPAVTIWWEIDVESGEILSERLDRILIRNRYAFSYDEVEFESNQTLKLVFKVSRMMARRYLADTADWDSHKVIETLMIMSNWKMAERLKASGGGIYRIHSSGETEPSLEPKSETPVEIAPDLAQALKQLRMDSAEYTNTPGSHSGLNLPIYTHFTSPIRRLVDIIVHRQLLKLEIFSNPAKLKLLEPIEVDLYMINDFNRRVKRLDRDLTWLKLMELARAQPEGYLDISACLIDHRNVSSFYLDLKEFPEIDKRFQIMETNLVPSELEHLFEIEKSNSNLIVKRKLDNAEWQFQFYRPFSIKLYAHPKSDHFNQKLGIEISGFSTFLKG